MRARAHQRGNAQVQRGLAAGGGDRANAAFQRRHPLLQHRIGRVADAAVDVAGALQVEQRGGVVAGLENEGGGEVNRHRPRARDGVGAMRLRAGRGCQNWGLNSRAFKFPLLFLN